MTGTRPGLVHSEHNSETMSNQHPTFPPSNSSERDHASSLFGRAPRGLSTREKLLAYGYLGAFVSLTIVLGYFLSPGSWSSAIATAAASYLIVSIAVAAGAGIRVLYRDWKNPPRHRADDSSAVVQAGLTAPSAAHVDVHAAVPERRSAPEPPSDFASIEGAVSYAQQSGFSIISLFTEQTPLSEHRGAVGAEIIYLALSHIAEIDKNASITVSGSALDGALTLTISARTAESGVLAHRRMGEIRALVDTLNGTVETDEHISTWTLTADIPAAAGTPT